MHLSKLSGILLINLGTPNDPSVRSVRQYLKQFLSDPRVIELPAITRWLLLHLVILPWRARKSAHAYSAIWQTDGSPLLVNSLQLQQQLQAHLGANFKVELGMRYGQPSISTALAELLRHNVDDIIILPLFPQYASAASGSALQYALTLIAQHKEIKHLRVISEFYAHPVYVQALVASIKPYIQHDFEYLLLSYHGIPEQQLINPDISCYRTKCLQTSRLLTENLGLPADKCSTSFQSRLGRLPWIRPYTDQVLSSLRARGVRKLLICCPSFVADCLETLEEIGIRAKDQWRELGGEELQLVPCLNAQSHWVAALAELIQA